MNPILIEFPVIKVLIIEGNPDTIMFQTNMVPSFVDAENNQQLPVLVMTVPQGTAQKYILETLQIPEDYVETGSRLPPPSLPKDRE